MRGSQVVAIPHSIMFGHHLMECIERCLESDSLGFDKGHLKWLWLRLYSFAIYLWLHLKFCDG